MRSIDMQLDAQGEEVSVKFELDGGTHSGVLSDHGYEPVPAYNGSEGLDKAKQAKPDLIFLDVMMPKKTGFILFEQLIGS